MSYQRKELGKINAGFTKNQLGNIAKAIKHLAYNNVGDFDYQSGFDLVEDETTGSIVLIDGNMNTCTIHLP